MNLVDLRFGFVSRIRRHESLFFPLMRANKRFRGIAGVPLVSAQTELLIEGYLRCANTFAALAFVQAQERKRTIANHTHAPASIDRAVRLGIPVLVLIRQPADVAISHVLKYPGLSLQQSLKWYSRFYDHIWPHRRSVVVADFAEVSTDFGAVVRRVNRRFGTDFTPFVHSDENVAKVFERIRKSDLHQNPNDINRISIPTDNVNKLQAKAKLRQQLHSSDVAHLLNRAREVYGEFLTLCEQP